MHNVKITDDPYQKIMNAYKRSLSAKRWERFCGQLWPDKFWNTMVSISIWDLNDCTHY